MKTGISQNTSCSHQRRDVSLSGWERAVISEFSDESPWDTARGLTSQTQKNVHRAVYVQYVRANVSL